LGRLRLLRRKIDLNLLLSIFFEYILLFFFVRMFSWRLLLELKLVLVYFYTCGFRRTSPIVFRNVFNVTWLFSFFLYLLILLLIFLLDCLLYRHVLFVMSFLNLSLLKLLLLFLCKYYALIMYILARLIGCLSWNPINIVIFGNIINILIFTSVNLNFDYSILRENVGHGVLLLNYRYAWDILKVNFNRNYFFIWNRLRIIFIFPGRSV
jgi:hypothetical protein